jgi:type II secretory pathway pseudopilin PulG
MNRPIHHHLAFSIMELLATLAVAGVLLVLAIGYVPALLEKAHATECTSNLHQIGNALTLYLSDNNLRMPNVTDQRFDLILLPYTNNNKSIFRCPSDPDRATRTGSSYRWNSALNNQLFPNLKMAYGNGDLIFTDKHDIVILNDIKGWHHHQPELKDYNKAGRMIFLYADGSSGNHPLTIRN